MAEAVVSFAVERLGDLLISEAKLLHGVSAQIKSVQCELERMQCFLEVADEKQNQDKRVRKWVSEIRELAFKIEDVTEIFAMEVATKKQKSGLKQMLLRFSCILNEAVSRHNITREINAIKVELANVTTSLQAYGITKGIEEGETSNSQIDRKSLRITYGHKLEKDFVGMKEEMRQLLSHLKNKETSCEVISICGMGGLGKTTLAKELYNHVEVKTHFKAFAWVCITQQFDKIKVLREVLEQLWNHEIGMMSEAKLVKNIYNVQKDINCFIVIDDIWTTNSWRLLEQAFPIGDTTSGSKILLTTRNEIVAQIGSVFKLQGLSEDEGWQLLSIKARTNDLQEKRVASQMEVIGKNMIKRCKGLPLAISSLGGILRGKSLKKWEMINKDISFYLANEDEYYTVRHVLGLSYDNLPPRLRHCFLCFANYEEDEEICTEELYMFWIAEGLISMEDKAEGETMFDVAKRYLDELAHRSLVEVERSKTDGESLSKNETCRIHDLILELCLFKVKQEEVINVFHLHGEPVDESKASIVRKLCIRSSDGNVELMLKPYDEHVISHIRSLIVLKNSFKYGRLGVWPDRILSLDKCKLLRVLIVSRYKITNRNIRSISKLVYLKYLCLQYCLLGEFPSSIGNLRNLETLDIRVTNPITIPNVIWKLQHLKHLYLPDNFEGGGAEKLKFKGLNELELIYNYESLYCDAHHLVPLPKLKVFCGKITVEDNLTEDTIDFIKSMELRQSEFHIHGGGVCCLVLVLECRFFDELSISTRICMFPKVYDHNRFSARLTVLSLINCSIELDPMILLERLLNLRSLSLGENSYVGVQMVCSSTGFPQLRKLYLLKLPGLRKWRVDYGAMPSLARLEICGCRVLQMLPHLEYLTTLECLVIHDMPTAFTDRITISDEEEVRDGTQGSDFYKVRHIPVHTGF